jgi:hypothetical protein
MVDLIAVPVAVHLVGGRGVLNAVAHCWVRNCVSGYS